MRKILWAFILLTSCSHVNCQQLDKEKMTEDLEQILSDLEGTYAYFDQKGIDIKCLKGRYSSKIGEIKSEEEMVLFFEYLLDEFYDSHLILNTNRTSSYRLFAPIYVNLQEGKYIVSNVWTSQLHAHETDIMGAEVTTFNNVKFQEKILEFPTLCNDKNSLKVNEWIANKVLAGRYNEPRILNLRLKNGQVINFDLDQIKYNKEEKLLNSKLVNNIVVIRINNSLGENDLVREFDQALDLYSETDGMIIDLRNTVDGGNSYVAKGIMSRFISEALPYQKHSKMEIDRSNGKYRKKIQRTWNEYVTPRKSQYTKPIVILVGRWTGSMGEGLAIGMDAMHRASIVGTEMERLAGEMNSFQFKNQNISYRISTAKIFHIDGTPREDFVPENYVFQSTVFKDEVLIAGLKILQSKIKTQ